jgi:hypothetical protein
MHKNLIIHIIHVAGTHMKAQGTDEISRGDKSMGVMRGIPIRIMFLKSNWLYRIKYT